MDKNMPTNVSKTHTVFKYDAGFTTHQRNPEEETSAIVV